MNVRRPWTQAVFDVLAAGPAHRDLIVELASPWVPQGHAYRAREYQRVRYMRRSRGSDVRLGRRRVSDAELHRIGARVVVNRTLAQLVRAGRIERDGDVYRLPVRSAGCASARDSA